jgi:hypothetical protein
LTLESSDEPWARLISQIWFEQIPDGGVISERALFDTILLLSSSLNPNTLHNMSCKNFWGSLIAQDLAGCAVEASNHLIHYFLAHLLKIGSLGEVPAEQSIGGFIGTSLPGAVRISKVGLHPKLFLQSSMQVMFTAIIQRGGSMMPRVSSKAVPPLETVVYIMVYY